MESKALEILRLASKKLSPLIVGFMLRNEPYHFLVKTSRGFHIFDNQDHFGQTCTKDSCYILSLQSFSSLTSLVEKLASKLS